MTDGPRISYRKARSTYWSAAANPGDSTLEQPERPVHGAACAGGPPLYPDFDQDHEGHYAYTTTDLLAGVGGWVSTYQPQIIMLHIGTNDIYQGRDNASTIGTIGQIIDTIRQHDSNPTILLAQIIPLANFLPQVQDFNSRIPALAQQKTKPQSPVMVIDQWTGFDVNADLYDGVHPNQSGEQKMANQWYAWLVKTLPNPNPPTSTPTMTPTSTPLPTLTPTFTPTPVGQNCGSTATFPQNYTIDSTQSNYVYTNFVSNSSITYHITVSGSAEYWTTNPGYQADPYYTTYDSWAHHQHDFMPNLQWEDGTIAVPDNTTYQGNHTYTFTRQGTCQPFGFRFNDTHYYDNSGMWQVTITTVSCGDSVSLPQSLTVNSQLSNYAYFSFASQSALKYQITVAGTAEYWTTNPSYQADAYYETYSAWASHQKDSAPYLQWEDGTAITPDSLTYQGNHTYTFTRQGTCQPFGIRFYDTNYSDNSGTWSVTIGQATAFAAPLNSVALLSGGAPLSAAAPFSVLVPASGPAPLKGDLPVLKRPGVPKPISPQGNITTASPIFSWRPGNGATTYKVEIGKDLRGEAVTTEWFDVGQCVGTVCTPTLPDSLLTQCTASVCTATLSHPLPDGEYAWRIAANNTTGMGPSSALMRFTVHNQALASSPSIAQPTPQLAPTFIPSKK